MLSEVTREREREKERKDEDEDEHEHELSPPWVVVVVESVPVDQCGDGSGVDVNTPQQTYKQIEKELKMNCGCRRRFSLWYASEQLSSDVSPYCEAYASYSIMRLCLLTN
ncbi:hypothetical protein HanIR_Chr16g0805121 [Helianthus annuus]|nr:hypothetical protein HanIR_Chr16g0805121 [Helianthus annuus]